MENKDTFTTYPYEPDWKPIDENYVNNEQRKSVYQCAHYGF